MKLFHFKHTYVTQLVCKLHELDSIPILWYQPINDEYNFGQQEFDLRRLKYPSNAEVIYKKCSYCDDYIVTITDGIKTYYCDTTLLLLRLDSVCNRKREEETTRLLSIDFDGMKKKMEKEDLLLVEGLLKQIDSLQKQVSSVLSENESLKNKLVIYESNK